METGYHEEGLSTFAKDLHRALVSTMEELEAVDWYNQRMDVTGDEQLRNILRHNRDEEIEHACMMLEYLRRLMPEFDEQLRTYLFTEAPIEQVEELAESGEGADVAADRGSLRIGKLS